MTNNLISAAMSELGRRKTAKKSAASRRNLEAARAGQVAYTADRRAEAARKGWEKRRAAK